MKVSAVASRPIGADWPVFFAAPHRVMFFAGALQLVATILFWAAALTGRYTAWWPPLDTTVPTTWAHAYLMLFGLFPFFIFGFLMTTYPKWLNHSPITALFYLPAFGLMLCGVGLLYAGLFSSRALVLAGVLSLLAGWATALAALLRVCIHGEKKPGPYERLLTLSLALGWLSAAAGAAWLLAGSASAWNLMIQGGLWLFLLPILWVVSYRMIPFFGSCVLKDYGIRRPAWILYLGAACMLGHFVLNLAGLPQWSFVVDIPFAVAALRLSLLWQFWRSFGIRLLAILHVAFLWLPVALILYSVQDIAQLAGGTFILGFAPLHALGIGYASSMVLAMATRVTMGHSGRPLQASGLVWLCFWGLQAAALLRIAADLPASWGLGGPESALWAALVWLICFGLWAGRHAPMYWRPRADGRPG